MSSEVNDDQVLSCLVYYHRSINPDRSLLLTRDKGLQRKAQLSYQIHAYDATALLQSWSAAGRHTGAQAAAQGRGLACRDAL